MADGQVWRGVQAFGQRRDRRNSAKTRKPPTARISQGYLALRFEAGNLALPYLISQRLELVGVDRGK